MTIVENPPRAQNGALMFPTLDANWQAARRHTRQSEQRAMIDELRAAIDQTLLTTAQEAHTAYQQAAADLQAAQQRVDAHTAAPPTERGDAVTAWARRKGELQDELAAYQQLATQAQERLNRAAQAVTAAIDAERRRQMHAISTGIEQAQKELQAQLAELDKQKQALVDGHNAEYQPKAARFHLLDHLYHW